VANTSAGIQEGLYVWDGTQWVRPVTEIPNANQEAHRMALFTTLTATANSTTTLAFEDNTGASLTIPQSGTYIFAFRLYGGIHSGAGQREYTIALHENGNATATSSAKISFYVAADNNYTYSILLAGTFLAGSTVNVKFTHDAIPWLLAGNGLGVANSTSMVWWKL
jgi:hypothetical protein